MERVRPAPRPPLRDPLFIAVCFAILTLPVEVSGLWFPTTLVNLSRIGMAAAMALAAIRLARERRLPRRPPVLLLAGILAVLGVDLASALATRWPDASRELGPLVFYGLFAVAVSEALTDRERIRIAAAAFVVAGAAQAALVVAQQVGDFYLTEIRDLAGRRNGTFIDPNITARFLVLATTVVLAAARAADRVPDDGTERSASRARGLLLAGLQAGLALAIVLTFSRSGWLLLALVVAASLALGYRGRATRVAAAAAVATFAAALLLVPNALHRATDIPSPAGASARGGPASALVASVVAVPGPPARTADAARTPLDDILDAVPIDPVRRYLVRAGIAMFLDHPLAGVGLGGFRPMLVGPYAEFILPDYRSAPVTLAHTDLVRVAAEEGLVGLAALALFGLGLVAAVRTGRRRAGTGGRTAFDVVAMAVAVVFLAAQTEGRFTNDPYLWLAVGALGALGYDRPTFQSA